MTSDCTRAAALIEKLFDSEASPDERREAEAHLETCAACRSHLEFLASVAEAARGQLTPEPPEAYWEQLPRKILSRIDAEADSAARGFLWKLFTGGGLRRAAPALAFVASLALLIALGVRYYRGSSWSAEPESLSRNNEERAPAPRPQAVPETAAPGERERARERAKEIAEAPPPSPSPRSLPSRKAPEPGQPEPSPPPMARDEKLSPSEAQKTENVEVADAARARIDAAAPPLVAPPAEATSSPGAESPVTSAGALRKADAPLRQPVAASVELARPESFAEGDCATLRAELSSGSVAEGENERDIRYRLALCSLGRYRREGGEALRRTALEDGDAFLAREKEGPRAEEIRSELEKVRPREK